MSSRLVRKPPGLQLERSYEVGRLQQHLATVAYGLLVPIGRRSVRARPTAACDPGGRGAAPEPARQAVVGGRPCD
jgi:hypothetical protein